MSVDNTTFSERKCHLLIFSTVRCEPPKKWATAFALSPPSSPPPSFFWRQWFAITILFLRTPRGGRGRGGAGGTQTDSRHEKGKKEAEESLLFSLWDRDTEGKRENAPVAAATLFPTKNLCPSKERKRERENKSQPWALLAPSTRRLQKATI